MTGVHDRPTLDMMLRPGRKSRILLKGIADELRRLDEREEHLEELALRSKSSFVIRMAREQQQRLAVRREEISINRGWTRRAPTKRLT